MPDSPVTLYTVKEAAALKGLHPRSLNRLLKQGKVDATRVGWAYLFTEDQVAAITAKPRKRSGK